MNYILLCIWLYTYLPLILRVYSVFVQTFWGGIRPREIRGRELESKFNTSLYLELSFLYNDMCKRVLKRNDNAV